jgi:acetate kinase
MKPVNPRILTINGGSSSIKFALYQAGEPPKRGLYGKVDRIGLSGANLTFDDPPRIDRTAVSSPFPITNRQQPS